MVQHAPSSSTPNGGHRSPPSRLLSKHRPRRRATVPPPPPPPPGSVPAPAPAPGRPDLTLCHCCRVRYPRPAPGAKRLPVNPLRSLWRIVLLCEECRSLVRCAAICSYCLSLDDLPLEHDSVACRRCERCVHHGCIPAEHRTALARPIDLENFVCIDCCPTVKPVCENGGATSVPKLEADTTDASSAVGGNGQIVSVPKVNAVRKTLEAKRASKCANQALAIVGGEEGSGRTDNGDPALPDEELALQLHLAINGSQRISRSGNASGVCSPGQRKGQKGLGSGRKGVANPSLCVTNMMDELDDDETGSEFGVIMNAMPLAQLDPPVSVVLALESSQCNGKHAEESMKGKRKGPPGTKHQNDLVDRYKNKYIKRISRKQAEVEDTGRYKKKYSKRNSRKQAEVEDTESKPIPDRNDMDGDDCGNGIAPVN